MNTEEMFRRRTDLANDAYLIKTVMANQHRLIDKLIRGVRSLRGVPVTYSDAEERIAGGADPVAVVGEPLLEHQHAIDGAEESLLAVSQRLVEMRAHLAMAIGALRPPT